MGYCTLFEGGFFVNKKLDKKTAEIINGLNKTRRMKRDIKILAKRLNISEKDCFEKYGKDGEFYFNYDNELGQTHTEDIVNYNHPPESQPSLWCNWMYNEEEKTIIWDGTEKFYDYIGWIHYIIENVLKPNNYSIKGLVSWNGEEIGDSGEIKITDNKVYINTIY